MAGAAILLVEDDASIRRFVALTLEDMAIELVCCATLAQAREALAKQSFQLVLCDLMLPDGHGLELLRQLHGDSALRGPAHLAVFSAGVSARMHEELQGLPLFRMLVKPVSMAQLRDCVAAAVQADAAAGPSSDQADPAAAMPLIFTPEQQAAIQAYFAGDEGLYAAFLSSCLQQFGRDTQAGNSALACGDLAALRRIVHSLKTVLLTLGDAEGHRRAAALEGQCLHGSADSLREPWTELCQRHLDAAAWPQAQQPQ